MRKKLWIILALFLVIPVLLGTVSCAKKTVTKEEPAPVVTPAPAPPPPPPVEDKAAKAFDMAKSEFLRENIYFAFDKSILDDMAQATLKNKAEFLKTYPDVYTTIEGHCDERGTPEYNLALGERRAESAKSFLVDLESKPIAFQPSATVKNGRCAPSKLKIAGPRTGEIISSSIRRPVNHTFQSGGRTHRSPDKDKIITGAI
jgi:peptidoglycan-associated lipoprotein